MVIVFVFLLGGCTRNQIINDLSSIDCRIVSPVVLVIFLIVLFICSFKSNTCVAKQTVTYLSPVFFSMFWLNSFCCIGNFQMHLVFQTLPASCPIIFHKITMFHLWCPYHISNIHWITPIKSHEIPLMWVKQ